jgi:O-antigen/teichoic acid export membrane protein
MINTFKNFFKKELVRGSVIIFGGSIVVSILNYLFHLVTGRMLGPEMYAVLASLLSLTYITGFPSQLLSTVMIKSTAKSFARGKLGEIKYSIIWFSKLLFFISFLGIILSLLLYDWIAIYLKIDQAYFILLILIFVLTGLYGSIFTSAVQGLKKFKEYTLISILATFLKIVFTVFLLFIGFKTGGALVALIVSSLVGIGLIIILLKNIFFSKTITKKISGSAVKSVVGIGFSLLGMSLMLNSDVLIVKHYFSSFDAGIYSSASNIGKIVLFLSAPILTVLLPVISFKEEKGYANTKEILFSLGIVSTISISVCVAYLLFPDLIVKVLYGAEYAQASSLIIILGVYYLFYSISSVFTQLWISNGNKIMMTIPLFIALLQLSGMLFIHASFYSIIYVMIASVTILCLVNSVVFAYTIRRK